LVVTTLVVFLLLGLAGVFRAKVLEVSSEPHAAPAPDVPQAQVRIITQPRFETAVGTVEPVHESAVASRLLARVVEANVKAGQAVRQDEILVRLDDADLQARLSQAKAAAEAALARKEQAVTDYERAAKLIEKNAISKAEYDRALTAVKTATSELESAQQAVREASVVLEYAAIRAPMSGVVVDKRVESGDMVTPGQILLTLYDPTRMQLVASVRESLAQRLAVGQQLPASLETLGYECQATISEIVPEAEVASRSFAVKVTGPCPPGVYSGMFGRLLIPVGEEEIVIVPAAAVRRVGQLTMVDVVAADAARRRHVQLGRQIDNDFEVLSGLRAGERVVLWNQDAAG
jgi:membrane fusion protein (multidrug efflux system)